MQKRLRVMSILVAAAALFVMSTHEAAWARAGGGRSFGSTGSRTFSAPSRTYTAPSRPAAPSTQPSAQPGTAPLGQPQAAPFGGFGRALAGGLLGGFLGSLLFRSMGYAGGFGAGPGGGFGLLELLLLAALAYGVYWMIRRGRAREAYATGYYDRGTVEGYGTSATGPALDTEPNDAATKVDLERGLQHIRQMDPSFNTGTFSEWATDAFFQLQAGWMHRDADRLRPLLTDQMLAEFRLLIDESRSAGRINRLENITVRSVEPVAAWQEQGEDYVTVRYRANLLDYTADERTGRVVQGDDKVPVKFEEYWTWVRPVGPNPWKLSAIQQAGG
jgi:predicted lipid-binding transport protein (Tim44 family)